MAVKHTPVHLQRAVIAALPLDHPYHLHPHRYDLNTAVAAALAFPGYTPLPYAKSHGLEIRYTSLVNLTAAKRCKYFHYLIKAYDQPKTTAAVKAAHPTEIWKVTLDPTTGCLITGARCNWHMTEGLPCRNARFIHIHPLQSHQSGPDLTTDGSTPILYDKSVPDRRAKKISRRIPNISATTSTGTASPTPASSAFQPSSASIPPSTPSSSSTYSTRSIPSRPKPRPNAPSTSASSSTCRTALRASVREPDVEAGMQTRAAAKAQGPKKRASQLSTSETTAVKRRRGTPEAGLQLQAGDNELVRKSGKNAMGETDEVCEGAVRDEGVQGMKGKGALPKRIAPPPAGRQSSSTSAQPSQDIKPVAEGGDVDEVPPVCYPDAADQAEYEVRRERYREELQNIVSGTATGSASCRAAEELAAKIKRKLEAHNAAMKKLHDEAAAAQKAEEERKIQQSRERCERRSLAEASERAFDDMLRVQLEAERKRLKGQGRTRREVYTISDDDAGSEGDV